MSEPYHLSERCFRLYEMELGLIVAEWPALHLVNPKVYAKSGTTVVARLRDAKNGLLKHGWSSDKINILKFKSIADQMAFSLLPTGQVVAGPKNAVAKAGSSPQVSVNAGRVNINTNQPQGDSPVYDVSYEGAKALCLAVEEFTRAIRIRGISQKEKEQLERNYDVEIESLGDGVYEVV